MTSADLVCGLLDTSGKLRLDLGGRQEKQRAQGMCCLLKCSSINYVGVLDVGLLRAEWRLVVILEHLFKFKMRFGDVLTSQRWVREAGQEYMGEGKD